MLCLMGFMLLKTRQCFLSRKEVETTGNPLSHAILRGAINEYGKNIPNYYYDNLMDTIAQYEKMGFGKSFYHCGHQS